jgi:hypothetical protein
MIEVKNNQLTNDKLDELLEWVESLDSYAERVSALTWLANEINDEWRERIARERAKAVRELRESGYDWTAIGKIVGVSRQRAYQIANG